MAITRLRPVAVLVLVVVAGCGEEAGTTEPVDEFPAGARIQLAWSGPRADAGVTLAEPLRARVIRRDGSPARGVQVMWSAEGGGDISPIVSVTDAAGWTEAAWTLAPRLGTQGARARAEGVGDALVEVEARLSSAARFQLDWAGEFTQPAGATLTDTLHVLISLPDGTPVEGVSVTWSTTGGGSVAPSSSKTGIDGRTAGVWTLAPRIGSKRATASVPELEETSVEVEATVPADAQLTVSAETATARVGGLLPLDLEARLLLADGRPLPGVPVEWNLFAGSGWIFPYGEVTGENGRLGASYVAGPEPAQTLEARVAPALSARTIIFAASQAVRANSIYLDSHQIESSDGFRTEIVPLHDNPATFYAALIWDGAYAGLQTSGDRFARQVHFSVWDAAGVDAVVVDTASSFCDPFGGEGTGQKCRFAYPWRVGDRYGFEMVAEVAGGRTDYTVVFKDLTQGITRSIATIRYGREANLSWVTAFVEDFGPLSSSCLTTHERSARIAKRERLSGGNWIRIEQARFVAVDNLSHCANVIVSEDEGGIRFGTGGTLVGDPALMGRFFPFP